MYVCIHAFALQSTRSDLCCVYSLIFQVLEMILFYGNYMNAGGRNAMSIGFEMKDLLKLANTKTGRPVPKIVFLVDCVSGRLCVW